MDKIYLKIIAGVERQQTIEKVIEWLRSYDFRFVEYNSLSSMGQIECYRPKHSKYSWMIRKGYSGKWDGTILFGIKMWGKKNSKVLVYSNHPDDLGYLKTIKKNWSDKADINFRKIVVKLKFPDYLTYEERRKWRTEYHKQKNNPNRIPTEWYLQHFSNIQFI